MTALIRKLCEDIPENAIRLNHPVCRIEITVEGALVSVGELEREPRARFRTRKVILALPPRLAAATLLFDPELSHNLTSGQAFSERGPLCEIHDGSNNSQCPYGLTGFVGIPAVQRNHQQLLTEAMRSQLAIIYGEPAAQLMAFFYQDWARERFTATQFDQPPMVEHPLYHPPAGQTSIWEGTIHFAGTETADQHGGYLEGALTAAERAVMNH